MFYSQHVTRKAGLFHTVSWDVQYGTTCAKYDAAYYTNTPFRTSLRKSEENEMCTVAFWCVGGVKLTVPSCHQWH
jgi:hypothetical protein